jgi:glutamyl-Q tRNA(Asp) synthetase
LVAACASYLFVKSVDDGLWCLRFDDLDTQRNSPGAIDLIFRQLELCGLFWDGTPVFQSHHIEEYQTVCDKVLDGQKAFRCGCSRQDLDRLSVVRNSWGERIYPGTCRVKEIPSGHVHASLRLVLGGTSADASGLDRFDDIVQGVCDCDLTTQWPAPVIRRSDGVISYHLANVLDDWRMGVSHVIRGADLLGATHVHRAIERLLYGSNRVIYGHVPLVVDTDGRKLSKSSRDELVGMDQVSAAGAVQRALGFLGLELTAEEGQSAREILDLGVEAFRSLKSKAQENL